MADPARYDECGYAPPRLTSDETRLAESYIHQLELEIDRLTAESAKLRSLVREAFDEPSHTVPWQSSATKAALDALGKPTQEASGDGANEV